MPRLEIALHGHLLVAGGQASALGVDLATARRPLDATRSIPYIPASAVRGAVRIQLEALLQGDRRAGTGPYPRDAEKAAGAPEPDDPVARLFGFSGKAGERTGARQGALRFGDALPADPERAAEVLRVRPGLEIENYTSTAEDQKLFFREVADVQAEPLLFHAELDIRNAEPEDIDCLRAAVETTDAIGAGKSKGGGAVTIRWIDNESDTPVRMEPPRARVEGNPDGASRARLVLTLHEPAHFGDGGPFGNHHGTRSYIPGATVRGAVAWALLDHGRTTPDSIGFRALFLDEQAPVSFGDALPVSGSAGEPVVHPATRREERGPIKEKVDILISELARERVNRALAGTGRYLRAEDGPRPLDPLPSPRPIDHVVRRTRTRVSIDRHTGAAADGRLFSVEEVEPWLVAEQEDPRDPDRKKALRPLSFVSWVEGLDRADPSAAGLLAGIASLPVLVGAKRNHGLGQVDLLVQFEAEAPELPGESAVLALAAEIDRHALRLAAQTGLGSLPSASNGAARIPLVLTALSDYVPSAEGAVHPLGEVELNGTGVDLAAPVRTFLNPGTSGGFDQRKGAAPLKDLLPAVGAGSVFVYEVPWDRLSDLLRHLLPAIRRGVGSRIDSGCGRFALFEPIS